MVSISFVQSNGDIIPVFGFTGKAIVHPISSVAPIPLPSS
jgi:hypothetical protein